MQQTIEDFREAKAWVLAWQREGLLSRHVGDLIWAALQEKQERDLNAADTN